VRRAPKKFEQAGFPQKISEKKCFSIFFTRLKILKSKNYVLYIRVAQLLS
jgi:hypothetical protein